MDSENEKIEQMELPKVNYLSACITLFNEGFTLIPNPKEKNFCICARNGEYFRITVDKEQEAMIESMAYINKEKRWVPLKSELLPEKIRFSEFISEG